MGHMYGDSWAGVPGHEDEYPLEKPAWWAAPMAPGAMRHLGPPA
eukprot:CAMPEP_0181131044 /NCGR_PEP_ID=MMETSP1071-20121207/30204_1 /TAXON_ID=35127 /ORGANISM="Thalassiosira sp., Strain NH16" /LENGTH=43 /DNA_ID= /DNA_START= /DNA_END= /DNA_ORIENTATION=